MEPVETLENEFGQAVRNVTISGVKRDRAIAAHTEVRALLEGRYNVSFEDVRRVCLPALRHRIILNFEAEAEGIEVDQVLLDIIESVPERADDAIVATLTEE